MQPESIIVGRSVQYPFQIEVLRFFPTPTYEDGLTLLFLHATNLHKEALIPLVNELLAIASPVRIKEVWVMDNPNHGRSAVLNHNLLESDEYREKWTPMDVTRAAYAFLTTTSHGVDFTKRKLVIVSQSGGSNGVVLLQKHHPELVLEALILLDPAVLPPGKPSSVKLGRHFWKMAKIKSDRWANIDEARQDLLNKGGFRFFNPAVFELFLKYALRPVDDTGSGAVTLASSRAHDISFHASNEVLDPSGEALFAICQEDRVPVHLIICPKDELRGLSDEAKAWQTEIINKTTHGSVQLLDKGGHLFPQVEPALAAQHLRTALLKIQNKGARL